MGFAIVTLHLYKHYYLKQQSFTANRALKETDKQIFDRKIDWGGGGEQIDKSQGS